MKRGWIALGMIAISLILGGIEYYYVTSNADVYIQMLDDADEKMAHNEMYEAESAAQKLYNRFSSQSGVFNIFMYHSELGDIASDLAMMRRYAQTGATEEFLATSACAKSEIRSIRNLKLLKWDNIL